MTNSEPATLTIRRLNDIFRQSLSGGGKRLMTAGIVALPYSHQAAILAKVMAFDQFTEDSDPHGEHDFGAFDHDGPRIFWKIDYYDASWNSVRKTPPTWRKQPASLPSCWQANIERAFRRAGDPAEIVRPFTVICSTMQPGYMVIFIRPLLQGP